MEDKTFQLLEKMYSEMKEGFAKVDERFTEIDERLKTVERTVLRIESDHEQKLQALFDGYIQNSEKLDRIQEEVSKHEEVIIRRVK